ncbi:MAG TPA: ABC transporter permease [Gaiellaceae bacterium]|nr:ABC transporter permease [Gaiellaceae bacterium]
MALPEVHSATGISSASWSPVSASDLLRLLNRYSFGFALLLMVALLLANLAEESWNFGWSDQLANFAPMALAAMASTPAIISGGGGFDLTISPLIYFIGEIFIIWLAPNGLGGAESVPIVLLIGAGVGMLNGLLIIGLRVPPVVATLSMYFVLIGADLKIAPNPQYLSTSWVQHLAHSVGPVPGAVFTLGFPLVVWGLLGLIPYRRTLYAVGSNDATAFASGVDVSAVRVAAYTLGGLFAAVGALALVGLTVSANSNLSQTYTLLAIASVALGGTSLWGGRGGLVGSMIGAACIYLLGNLLTTLQIDPSYLQVMYGGMLVFAVILGGVAAKAKAAP